MPHLCAVAVGINLTYAVLGVVNGTQSQGSVAEVCPVACGRCSSNNATTLTVTTGLIGDCRLRPVLNPELVEEGTSLPSVTISARDAVGITLLPDQTLDATPLSPLEFTVVGLRKRAPRHSPTLCQICSAQTLTCLIVPYNHCTRYCCCCVLRSAVRRRPPDCGSKNPVGLQDFRNIHDH